MAVALTLGSISPSLADDGTALDGAGYKSWKYANTVVATFTPAKRYEGWILESGENTNMGGLIDISKTTFILGDDAQNKQYRSILSFDTSTLPDTAVVTGVTLRIRQHKLIGTNPFATHGNILIDIVKGFFGRNVALRAGDFQAVPGKAGIGVIRNNPDPNLWFTATLSQLAYPFINPLGVTQLRLRFQKDDNNDNSADFIKFVSADSTVFSDVPLLEVMYYVP